MKQKIIPILFNICVEFSAKPCHFQELAGYLLTCYQAKSKSCHILVILQLPKQLIDVLWCLARPDNSDDYCYLYISYFSSIFSDISFFFYGGKTCQATCQEVQILNICRKGLEISYGSVVAEDWIKLTGKIEKFWGRN